MVFFSKFISYFAFLYCRAIDKFTLIAKPAITYMPLHKIMFIDAI